ncbi:MAG: Flp family type IVb pilin [Chloroflexota bacterium]
MPRWTLVPFRHPSGAGIVAVVRSLWTHLNRRASSMVQYLLSLINRDERGQGLAEYALILALIAVLAIAAVTFLGGQINAILSDVGTKI